MRFRRVRVERFGPLGALGWGEKDPLPSLVAVLGPNEAGKSAFHALLVALLYGFYPASRDGNEWAPWDGGDIDVRAGIETGEGDRVEVHRRLLSSPWGRLRSGDRVRDLRNEDLPFVGHVGREVFRQVYALTLADLASLEGSGWEAVEDRLLVGMGARDLRSPREVAKEWTEAGQRLWRPDRMGKPRDAKLRARLKDLRELRREALERDRAIREAEARIHELEAELEGAGERLRELSARLERLRRVEELEGRLPEQEEELRRTLRRIDEARNEIEAFTDLDRELSESSAELRALASRLHVLQERAVQRGKVAEEIRRLERRVRETATPLLRDDAPPPTAAELEGVRIPELERAIAEAEGAAAEEARSERELAELPDPGGEASGRGRLALGAALLAAGLGLVAFAPIADERVPPGGALWTTLGIALALAGAWVFDRARAARSDAARRERERARLGASLERARERAGAASAAIGELLAGLPLRPSVAGRPTATLATSLVRLRELLQDLEDRRDLLRSLESDRDETVREIDRIRERLLPDLPHEPAAALSELARRIAVAEKREEEARGARGLLEELEGERARVEAEIEELREEARSLRSRLGEEEPDEGTAGRLDADRRLLDEERERKAREVGELKERIRLFRRERTSDVLEGEIRIVEEEMERIRRERDRLHVLTRLLARAERRFREAHQPDLLRRASAHLAEITGGRYPRLVLEEGEDGATTFHLQASHLPRVMPVAPPLSTGTREQVYLALRLAIVDHLDEGRETLPLFLDEVFVNWDAGRRTRGMDLLARIAADRQVFLFTCHPQLAGEVEERGGRVVELGGPVAGGGP